MLKKKNMILAAAAVAAIGIIAFVLFLVIGKKDDGYRMMQVYQVEGTAVIERENIGVMEAYENLNLISGDAVKVESDSYMRLKVDDDKYVLAEAGSEFRIYATGKENSGKTDIQLEKGAITVEVQNKLSEDSSFEVSTPNSVMAVRGTVFRITADVDENGEPITRIAILEGSVLVQKKDENGNLSDEQTVDSGNEAIVYKEADDLWIKISDEIGTTDIPLEVLEFLQEIAIERRELCITSEQIRELIEQLGEGQTENGDPETETMEETSETEETTETEETLTEKTTVAEEAETSTIPEQEPETVESTEEMSSEQADVGDDEDGSSEPEDTQPATYTVTFVYNGQVFATQTVAAGSKISKPLLMPAPSGKWNVDFDAPVSSDMQVEFVQ